jgi:putative Holliday junction resolvase
MPEGTVLAFDFGEKRIGVATGETLLASAHPLAVIRAESNDDRFAAIGKLIAEWQPVQLVVGLPTHADGTPHEMTRLATKPLLDAVAAQIILQTWFESPHHVTPS